MRIALVYRSFHRAGSLAGGTVELARHLSQRHEVHVFSIDSQTDPSLAPGCVFHAVPVTHVGDGRRFSARELWSFARNAAALLEQDEFDVVHTCAPSTWVADVLHLPGLLRQETRQNGMPTWRYAAMVVRRPGDATRILLERRALRQRRLRRIHVEAPAVREALARRFGSDGPKVLLTPPAVNLEEFRPSRDKNASRRDIGIDDPNVLVLLFCGSDFERKGLDRAICALAGASVDAMLVVVGSGPQESFRRLATRLGISEKVRFYGSRSDAWRFHQAADIFLLPTRADVWGVTPIEAMACGVPPIVSTAAGSSATIQHGSTGVLLPEPLDIHKLRDAIDWLGRDPARRAAIASEGLVAAREHSWETRGRQVEEDLLAVVAERRTSEQGPGHAVAL